MYAPESKWTMCFLAIVAVQNLIVLVLESFIFGTAQQDLLVFENRMSLADISISLPTFTSLFIFALFYQLLLVYDALRQQNTIQVIGLVAMNLALLLCGFVQLDTVTSGISISLTLGDGTPVSSSVTARSCLVGIICVLAVGTLVAAFVAWKLNNEFAWAILRLVSADLKMRRRYLSYQIYLTLLKFGFFYYLGFLIQFLVVLRGRNMAEIGVTAACIPVATATLLMAVRFMKFENMIGMVVVIALFFAGLAFFLFKLTQLYMLEFEAKYIPVRKQLTSFAVLTIIIMIATIVNACICVSEFGKGLKPFLNRPIMEDDPGDLDQHEGVSSASDRGLPGQNIEMVSNLRARLGGYQPARSR